MGKVAYQLELPDDARIHNIFHVSQLKKATGIVGPTIPLPGPLIGTQEFEPIAILKKKLVKRGNRPDVRLLVHWKHLSLAEATWEFSSHFSKRFPYFSLEDKGS